MIFKNVNITNSGVALRGFRLIKNSVFPNVLLFEFYKYSLFKKITEKKITFNKGNYLIIHNHWSTGYHHWVTEALVRLFKVDSRNYDLIIPENYPEFAFESLKTFQFNSICKLPKKTGCFLPSVTIPPNPPSGVYNKVELLAIKNHFFSVYGVSENPTKNIYITRKNAPKRKVENEDEVISVLKAYNCEIMDTSLLTFQQQVELFSQCKIIISIHGAGLTNVLFMQHKTHLIEFYKEKTFINPCYENMCNELDIHFHRIVCEGGKNKNTHVNFTDLIVNKHKLEEVLKKIIE